MLLIDAKTPQLSKEEVKKYPGRLSQSERRRYFERIILWLLFKRMRLLKNISVTIKVYIKFKIDLHDEFFGRGTKKMFPRKYRYYHNRSLQPREDDLILSCFNPNVLDIVTQRHGVRTRRSYSKQTSSISSRSVTAWGHEALIRSRFNSSATTLRGSFFIWLNKIGRTVF